MVPAHIVPFPRMRKTASVSSTAFTHWAIPKPKEIRRLLGSRASLIVLAFCPVKHPWSFIRTTAHSSATEVSPVMAKIDEMEIGNIGVMG
jgi:hypothetical protein